MVHITGITPALSEDCRRSCMTLAKRAHEIGAMVSFDPNIREKLWKSREEMVQTLNDIAFHSDVVLQVLKKAEFLPVQMCLRRSQTFIWNMALKL